MADNDNAHTNSTVYPWETDGLRLHVLGSGSRGNAAVIETPHDCILVDAGLSCRQITVRMQELQLDPSRIRAIVVTHDHSDHIAGIRVSAKKFGVPVYTSAGTAASTAWHHTCDLEPEILAVHQPITLAGICVTPFHVPHDADETLGFRFQRSGDSIAYCTDLGELQDEAAEYLADARILAIESNHDAQMLSDYTEYPAHLRSRIASDHGHLSNDQAATALQRLVTSQTQHVVAMHLSQHTNLPSLCRNTLLAGRETLPASRQNWELHIASQDRPSSCL